MPQRVPRTCGDVVAPHRHAVHRHPLREPGVSRPFDGVVLEPGDPGFETVRAGWHPGFRSRPRLIVVAATTQDVAEAVRVAAAGSLPVAVRGPGHGQGPAPDGALLIVTARLAAIEIDVGARVATVQAGAPWHAVLAAARAHGLAPAAGRNTGLDLLGPAFGGGIGWLARHLGVAGDGLVAADLMTADGPEVRGAADLAPADLAPDDLAPADLAPADLAPADLAPAGIGTGARPVVTGVRLGLQPTSAMSGGTACYPVGAARDVLRFFRQWIAAAPPDLTCTVTLLNVPQRSASANGRAVRSLVLVRVAQGGAGCVRGEAVMSPWHAWRRPEPDLLGASPWTQPAPTGQPLPALQTWVRLRSLHENAVDAVLEATLPVPGRRPMLLFSELTHAAAEGGGRGEPLLRMAAVPTIPDAIPALEAHLRHTRAKLAPYAIRACGRDAADPGQA